jgi:hypothetical protein
LGDKIETTEIETTERHYAPFVPALREKGTANKESHEGSEGAGKKTPSSSAKAPQVQ